MTQSHRPIPRRPALCTQAQGIIARCLRCFPNSNSALAIPIRINIGGPLISGNGPIPQSNRVAGQGFAVYPNDHTVFIFQDGGGSIHFFPSCTCCLPGLHILADGNPVDRIDGIGGSDGGGIAGTPIDTVVMAHNDPAALSISSGFIGFHIGSRGRLSCIVGPDDYIVLPIGNGSIANGNGILGRPPDTEGTAILDICITASHMGRMTDGIVGQSLAAPGQGHCCVSRSLAAANGQGALSIGRGSVPHCQGIDIPIRRSPGIHRTGGPYRMHAAQQQATGCTDSQETGLQALPCSAADSFTFVLPMALGQFGHHHIGVPYFAPDDLVNSVHGFFPLRAFCPCLPYRQISVFEKKIVFVKFLFHIEFSFRNHYWLIRKK